jgi:hypothetical protein
VQDAVPVLLRVGRDRFVATTQRPRGGRRDEADVGWTPSNRDAHNGTYGRLITASGIAHNAGYAWWFYSATVDQAGCE